VRISFFPIRPDERFDLGLFPVELDERTVVIRVERILKHKDAYAGHLPAGAVGIEFESEVPPDNGHVPGKPTWSATPERPGVMRDDDYAKIKVHVLRQTVILERGHA